MCVFVSGDLGRTFSWQSTAGLSEQTLPIMASASAHQYLLFRLSAASEMQALLIVVQLVWRFVGNRETNAKRINIGEGICRRRI